MKNTVFKGVSAPALMMLMSRQCPFHPQSIVVIHLGNIASSFPSLLFYCLVKYSCLAVNKKELLL